LIDVEIEFSEHGELVSALEQIDVRYLVFAELKHLQHRQCAQSFKLLNFVEAKVQLPKFGQG
jgi:hypothetical protein